jgi:hypothetical protein
MGRPLAVEQADDAGARGGGGSIVGLSRGWEHRSTAMLGRTRMIAHSLRRGGVNSAAAAEGRCHTRFLSQNRMLIVCVPRNQVYTHTV